MQVLADPKKGPTAPFILLERFEAGQLSVFDPAYDYIEFVDLDGLRARFTAASDGYGDGFLQFADGTEAYIRARGLGRTELEAVAVSMTPREPTTEIAGFDYDTSTGPSGLVLVAEQRGSIRSGRAGSFECRLHEEIRWIYRIGMVVGDPIFEYVAILDRPVPIEVGYQHGTLIVINGTHDPRAPTVSQVENAPHDEWSRLLGEPDANGA